MAEPIYIPTNSIQGFPFLHIPDNICSVSLFDDSHSDRCEVMLMVVSFTFPWWLVMLNIFAFVGHLYVIFGKMSSQNLCPILGASQVALVVKNPPTNAEDLTDTSSIPGSGSSPEGGHGTHSGVLAWRIPWTAEPGRLQSTGPQGLDTAEMTYHACTPSF